MTSLDVAATVAAVTPGAPTNYDASSRSRTGSGRIPLQPGRPAGHGNNAIEAFLRHRVGYCEQFAGTYAAMARTLGFPSRLAVGFTSG